MSNPRITFKVPGGLGNQLFSYYCALYAAEVTDTCVSLDFSSVDRSHYSESVPLLSINMPENQIHVNRSSLARRKSLPLLDAGRSFCERKFSKDQSYVFGPHRDSRQDVVNFLTQDFPEINGKVKIEGYFGDFGFYDAIQSQLKILSLINRSSCFLKLQDELLDSNQVAVHHRLGDFLHLSESVGVLDESYYKKSFGAARSLGYEKFLVFSNEPKKSRSMFELWGFDMNHIQWVDSRYLTHPLENLLLMGHAKSLICSNSTFSFWAAKLAIDRCEAIYYPSVFRRDQLAQVLNIPGRWNAIDSSWMTLVHAK